MTRRRPQRPSVGTGRRDQLLSGEGSHDLDEAQVVRRPVAVGRADGRLAHADATDSRIRRNASASPAVHGSPCPGSTQLAERPSSAVSDASARSWSTVNGPRAGPTLPLTTDRVVIASPMKIASTAGTLYATEPGVCPGIGMTSGAPGKSSVVAPSTAVTTLIGVLPIPPWVMPYHRNPSIGPIRIGSRGADGFLISPRASAASAAPM